MSFPYLKIVSTKYSTHKYLRYPVRPAPGSTIPAVKPGQFLVALDTHSSGISFAHKAFENDNDAVAAGFPQGPDTTPFVFDEAFDPTATLANKQLWFSMHKAKTESIASNQKVNAAHNNILAEVRESIRSNPFLNLHIGTMDLDNMSLHQILLEFFQNRVLTFQLLRLTQ
jgi:hypothetical protein